MSGLALVKAESSAKAMSGLTNASWATSHTKSVVASTPIETMLPHPIRVSTAASKRFAHDSVRLYTVRAASEILLARRKFPVALTLIPALERLPIVAIQESDRWQTRPES